MFIVVCSCGMGVVGEDRDELAGKASAHLAGRFYPAGQVGEHAAWMGEASTKLSIDVKTEAI